MLLPSLILLFYHLCFPIFFSLFLIPYIFLILLCHLLSLLMYVFLFPSPLCSLHCSSIVVLYYNGPVSPLPCGANSQPVYMSVFAPVHGQISLSSELQPGSLPPDADADESSSDMLVIVDDPVSSAPQSRATNSPASVSGSVSDNMNGERTFDFFVLMCFLYALYISVPSGWLKS